MLKECYYLDQTDWKTEDYYTLHMFLMKMVENYDTTVGSYDGRKRIEEIKSIDLSRMSEESKVLLYCVIQNEGKQFLFDLPNLSSLRAQKPLEKPLRVTKRRRANNIPVYRKYGVFY
jgi:hypothetical protein